MSEATQDALDFWVTTSKTPPNRSANFAESIEETKSWSKIQTVLSTMTPQDKLNPNYKVDGKWKEIKRPSIKELMIAKKDQEKSDKVARVVASSDEEAAAKAAELGVFDADTQQILIQVQNEVSKRYLEMYYDCYMSPLHSDIKWRLGPVSGVYMPDNKIEDPTGLLTEDGRMYTRSNMQLPITTKFWMGGNINEQEQFYSNLWFPPYKMGMEMDITKKTNLMRRVLRENPNATFDQDQFTIKKQGFTYREAGFKALNDNIMFLQWIVERCTGIVSTYMTEWDLSIYMQENLMTPMANGGPARLWLNYRVRKDNPLASDREGYNNDKGLVFSVINSAVSKIDFDCQRSWRPSDFPMSVYWRPYKKDVDWEMHWQQSTDEDTDEQIRIPYASWADEDPNFNYKSHSVKDVIRHQDFIGMALSEWNNIYMEYYQALYYTDSDMFASCEIWHQSWLKAVSGAEAGESTAVGKDLPKWLKKCREDTIVNGGFNGTQSGAGVPGSGGGAGSSGSSGNAQAIKRIMKHATRSLQNPIIGISIPIAPPLLGAITIDGKPVAGTIFKNPITGYEWIENAGLEVDDGSSSVNELKQKTSAAGLKNQAADLMADISAGQNGKVNASSMAKTSGVNRWSPTMWGGPHGSSYSPLSIQGYFETHNQFLRNTPRVSGNTGNEFTSKQKDDYKKGVDRWYYNNESGEGTSPAEALKLLKGGYSQYTMEVAWQTFNITTLVKGQIKYVNGQPQYIFPSQINGQNVFYTGSYIFQSMTIFQPYTTWGNDEESRKRYWSQYYSYWNDYNIRIGPVTVNGRQGYNTIIKEVYRYATYKTTRLTTYKKYLLNDMPDVKWSLTQHKFLQYSSDNSGGGPIWAAVNANKGQANIRQKIQSTLTSQSTAWVLNFDSQADQTEFINKMIKQSPTGQTQLVFCGGNEGRRYSEGPEFIFIATCKVQTYQTIYKKVWRHSYTTAAAYGGGILGSLIGRILSVFSHDHVDIGMSIIPYVVVDISGQIPMFYDKLNVKGFSNKYKGNSVVPLQLDSIPQENDYIEYATDILQKFNSNHFNLMGSYREEPSRANLSRKMTWSATNPTTGLPSNALSPQPGAAIAAPVVSGKELMNTYKEPGYIERQRTENDGGKFPDRFTGPIINKKIPEWESKASMGISGIGILSCIQGLENEDTMDIQGLSSHTQMQNSINNPINQLNSQTNFYTNTGTIKTVSPDGQEKFESAGTPSYGSKPLDTGLKRALSSIFCRSIFYKEDEPDKPYLINNDTQFRSLFNICLYQITFLKMAKELLLDNVDFEVLRKMLLECMDKCVLKASGMTVDGPTAPDNLHVLYDYWIERAINLWGNVKKHEQNRLLIIEDWQNKISKLEYAISILQPLVNKDMQEWSYKQILNAYGCAALLSKETDRSIADDYVFAYLHMLYHYRMYFIGKRFNKEDGTMWVMRQLESIIEFIAPWAPDNNSPPPLHQLVGKQPCYNVAFYEIQNTTGKKRDAIINNETLDLDRIKTVYIRVQWRKREDYIKWLKYKYSKTEEPEVPEIVKIYKKNKQGKKIVKYAIKPQDTDYKLISKELLENDKNIIYNAEHPTQSQRLIREDIDLCVMPIQWGDSKDKTPIRYNIFYNVDIDSIIEYVNDGVSPEELLCLAEQGADFWTVHIPENLWPRSTGFKNQVQIKHYEPPTPTISLKGDPFLTILGSQGYSLWPIHEQQERPAPGMGVPDVVKSLNPAVNKY